MVLPCELEAGKQTEVKCAVWATQLDDKKARAVDLDTKLTSTKGQLERCEAGSRHLSTSLEDAQGKIRTL